MAARGLPRTAWLPRPAARCDLDPFKRVNDAFGHVTGDDVRALVRRADLALYTAKQGGRDRVVGLPSLCDPAADIDEPDNAV